MKIGIICAAESELAPFLAHIENDMITEKAMLYFHGGQINGIDIEAVYCGVCKVNAALAAQTLIDSFGVTAVINSGTAGGMDENLEIFDTVITTETAYHDVAPTILTEYHPWMTDEFFRVDARLLTAAQQVSAESKNGSRIFFGRTVTGEAFITDEGRCEINEKFKPLTVDMETAAIAHVCYVNDIPFIAVRTVTDTARHSGAGNFVANCDAASVISCDAVLALIDKYKGAVE